MNVREFRQEDRDLYLKMAEDFYSTDATMHGFDREAAERNFDEIMKGSSFLLGCMIEQGSQPFGYGLLAFSWSTEKGRKLVYLEELYLCEHARGRGLGSYFLNWLSDTYDCALRLEVSPENSRVMNLYERFDFKTIDYIPMAKW